MVWKTVEDKNEREGASLFVVEDLLSHRARKVRRRNRACFRNFLESKKVKDSRKRERERERERDREREREREREKDGHHNFQPIQSVASQ